MGEREGERETDKVSKTITWISVLVPCKLTDYSSSDTLYMIVIDSHWWSFYDTLRYSFSDCSMILFDNISMIFLCYSLILFLWTFCDTHWWSSYATLRYSFYDTLWRIVNRMELHIQVVGIFRHFFLEKYARR